MNLEFAGRWLTRNTARAKRIEDALRERALLPVNLDINGIPVKQFTLEHWLTLTKIRSPFLVGGRKVEIEDIGQFLWIVSPECSELNFDGAHGWILRLKVYFAIRKRRAFLRRVVRQPRWFNFEPRIRKYLKRAFMDRPASNSNGTPISAGLGASMIYRLAYGANLGSRKELREMPIAEAFQYLNWKAANQPQFNPLQGDVINRWYVMAAPFQQPQPSGAAATDNSSIPTSSHVSPLALLVIPEVVEEARG